MWPLAGKRIWVAGHRGMVGSAIVRRLATTGAEVLTVDRAQLDLLDQSAVRLWLANERPDAIVLAAAKVGGILANSTYPADFLYDNLMIAANVIEAAHQADVNRLLFLGSSCIYPKLAPQPLKEESLLTGLLEETNEPYAIAKIAGIKMVESYRRQYGRDYISAMPTNLYGPNDNYDLKNSHVMPALIRKFHTAKQEGAGSVEVWGTGSPMREFLHVNDLADACFYLLQNYHDELFVNIGTGTDLTIKALAELIQDIVGFKGDLQWDTTKPDGTPRKLMDVSRLHTMGWKHKIELREGITEVYEAFKKYEGAKV